MEELIMDKAGYAKYLEEISKIEKELDDIRHYKGKVAIFQGDGWHDNPTLYQTEMQERGLMRRLLDMKEKLKNIKIVDKIEDDLIVDIGDTVNIAISPFNEEPEEMIIKLVGHDGNMRSDISEVSINSPLGTSIYKKKIGESSGYRVGDRQFSVKILEKLNMQIENETPKEKIK